MRGFVLILLLFTVIPAIAEDFWVSSQDTDVIGRIREMSVKPGETLVDIARQHAIGQNDILLANQAQNRWVPDPKKRIILPTQYILPDSPRNGLVLNLPELRLYHYPENSPTNPIRVSTYAVSIGRVDWDTPLVQTHIVYKRTDPSWTPPESIKQEALEIGKPLPDIVPAGPNNPLGKYALNLDVAGYLIHGTNKPFGIGMRVTHGCIRMYPEDIDKLYGQAAVGTTVHIVNQPVKVGWLKGKLYMEVHPALEESSLSSSDLLETAVALVQRAQRNRPENIRSSLVRRTVNEQTGIPVMLSYPE